MGLKKCFEDEDAADALEKQNEMLKRKRLQRTNKTSPKGANSRLSSPNKQKKEVSRPASQDENALIGDGAFITEAATRAKQVVDQVSDDDFEDDDVPTSSTNLPGHVAKRDIVDMILVWEDKMNQLIYADKQSYFVYRESDERSEQLRRVTGGHNRNISAIKFSYHLSLIATGTESGEVAVWDYELSQLLGICHGHSFSKGEITAIEFLEPYPIMVTAGLDSRVCLWTVRPVPTEKCYVTIGIFNNISFNYHDDTKYPVRSMKVYSEDNLSGISRG